MKVEMRALDTVKPYEKNAKKHDQTQIDNVAESIRQYGFVQPIVVDKDGIIVIGHCRALGAKKLGLKQVPCVCVDDLTPEQVNALRLVDNKSNESDWDFDLLADELPMLVLDGFDFDWGLHPTMKPLAIIENQVKICSKKDGIVVDIFGGSGSTLIACEQLDRTCYMMELDPKYCDVIIKRWENFTGEKAVLLNGDR